MVTNPIVFRQSDRVGHNDAHDDLDFLKDCFIETDQYKDILDTHSHTSIILGRTGSGKTAIIQKIKSSQKLTIEIKTNLLAVNYDICGANILKLLEDLEIDLFVLYKYLWMHIIVTELLDRHYHSNFNNLLAKVDSLISKKKIRSSAKDYLQKWEGHFFVNPEKRIDEITNILENNINGEIGVPLHVKLQSKESFSIEEKTHLKTLVTRGVNKLQIQQLDSLIQGLGEIFDDPKKKFFVTIDGLDENWVSEKYKYKLIMSLLESIRAFSSFDNIKIIVALRTDLLESVIINSRDKSFQSEKYESYIARLFWQPEYLLSLVQERLNFLFKKKYSEQSEVDFYDLFPKTVDNVDTWVYIWERTMCRPRDIIAFLNECISQAQNKIINSDIIIKAEEYFSYDRFTSLCEEWRNIYPSLKYLCDIFKGIERENFFSDMLIHFDNQLDKLSNSVALNEDEQMYDFIEKNKKNSSELLQHIVRIFYKTGIIGIRRDQRKSDDWEFKSVSKNISYSEISVNNSDIIKFNPMLNFALNLR